MKFQKQPAAVVKPEGYVLTVHTMEGDADDYHKFDIAFSGADREDELAKHVIALEVIAKTYTCGRNRSDEYSGEYWDLINESSQDWNWSEYSDSADSFDSYAIVYNDGLGGIFPVEATLSQEDLDEVKAAPVQGNN